MTKELFPSRRMLGALGLAGLMALGPGAGAQAQTWPERPVTIIVPFPAGGNTDTMARLLAERLQRKLGQGFVIDNRPAGGGIVATGQVARAKPDGYTLMFGSAGQNIILPMLYKVNYDPVKDLAPISIFGTGAFILGAKKDSPFNTMPELIAYAKAHPGKLNVASAGNGSIGHLTAALFAKRANIDIVPIPYKGGGPAIAALVAGETDIYFGNASELLQFVATDRIKLIAVSTPERLPQIPEIPPVASIFPGFTTSSWNGLLGPVGLPAEVTSKLVKETAEAARDPALAERLTSLGIKPIGSTPEEFAAIVASERPVYREAVDAAGLKMEE
jgi:hypothetical protein